MTTTQAVTYTRLRDGSWGLRGAGLTAGASVTVRRKDGQERAERVGKVLWTGDGVSLATIAGAGSSAGSSGSAHRGPGMWCCAECGDRCGPPSAPGRCWETGGDHEPEWEGR